MQENDIYRAYNFKLDVGGNPGGAFSEVTGLEVTIEAIGFREGGAKGSEIRKFPGRVDIGDVTLKYGLAKDTYLWDWVQKLAAGESDRRNVSIMLMPPDGDEPLARWNLNNAWIRAWRGAKLDAMGQQLAIEEVTLVAESLTRGNEG